MGFSFRKKIKVGKNSGFNLSGSGISFSTGVKGARVVHRFLGKGSGRTTVYAQKKIGGLNARYIKSFGGGSDGVERKNKYDFEDFHSSKDVENFDDYLGEDADSSSDKSAVGFSSADWPDDKLPVAPKKPGVISWGWFAFWILITLWLYGLGGWIYLIVRRLEKNNPAKLKQYEDDLKSYEEALKKAVGKGKGGE
jgi:hypothetical protein